MRRLLDVDRSARLVERPRQASDRSSVVHLTGRLVQRARDTRLSRCQDCSQRMSKGAGPLEQHVISGWLLRAFSRPAPGGRVLDRFDKATGDFDLATPADFMTEADGHSAEIEEGIERIETPASAAGRRLAKVTRTLPPGFYAVMPPTSTLRAGGPAVSDQGGVEGMRLLVSAHELPSPSQEDRLALGRFAGLMYQRSPRLEGSILRFGRDYDVFAQMALDELMPGMRTGLASGLSQRRSRIPALAVDIGGRLADSNWWILRPEEGDEFVLADSPVAATISLGHDDEWRAIFSSDSYLIAMPIGPTLAILVAPQHIIPLAATEPTVSGVTRAVNRLMWRHADRSVLARQRRVLEGVWSDSDQPKRLEGIEIPHNVDHIADMAVRQVVGTVLEVMVGRAWAAQAAQWQHWVRCRLEFGSLSWPTADRDLLHA